MLEVTLDKLHGDASRRQCLARITLTNTGGRRRREDRTKSASPTSHPTAARNSLRPHAAPTARRTKACSDCCIEPWARCWERERPIRDWRMISVVSKTKHAPAPPHPARLLQLAERGTDIVRVSYTRW